MARIPLSNSQWTDLGTTASQMLFGPEGGDARFWTGDDPSGLSVNDGFKVEDGWGIVIPTGLHVWAASCGGTKTTVVDMDFGS